MLQDLWHSKVDQLLANKNRIPGPGEEEISCDWPKYWLDEHTSLFLHDKDAKFVELNELVDDIDNFQKAIRACCSEE